MSKILKLGLVSLLIVIALYGCNTTTNNTAKDVIYKDGTYTASSEGYEDFGEVQLKDIVTIEVVDGKISSVDWNQEIKDGGDRKAISKESQDMVTRGGAKAPWFEQAEKVTTHLLNTQDLTPPDTISGVSIEIVDFFALANKALKDAK